jgi:hypothetical protein
MNADIKLPNKNTNFSKMNKYDWDVVIGNQPMRVGRLEGYVHSIGGRYGFNELYAWHRDEEPCYENVIPFNGIAVNWGIEYNERNYYNSIFGDIEIDCKGSTTITRNGKPFYTIGGDKSYSIPKAITIINDINEYMIGSIDFNIIDYAQKEIIGRKVRFRGVLCTVKMWIEGQGCIIIEPDSGDINDIFKVWGFRSDDDEKDIKLDIILYHYDDLDWLPVSMGQDIELDVISYHHDDLDSLSVPKEE